MRTFPKTAELFKSYRKGDERAKEEGDKETPIPTMDEIKAGYGLSYRNTPLFSALRSSPTFVARRAMKLKRLRPAGRSGPTAGSGASRQKQILSSR